MHGTGIGTLTRPLRRVHNPRLSLLGQINLVCYLFVKGAFLSNIRAN